MADVIRIKRRVSPGSPGAPSSLANAELAFNENDGLLYVGIGTGGAGGSATSIVAIGGTGFAPLASPTFTGDPKAPTPATADNDTSIATTAYVKAQGYQTTNATITLSGDVSGSGTTAITATLATVNGNVGTFQGITVNAKGLVTAATNQNYAPLASPVFTGDPQAPTPTAGDNDTSIATTAFVQTAVQNASAGLDPKQSVKAATTANITLLGTPQTIDGISCATGDRVLVKDQTTQANNGIYIVASGAWGRATDMDAWTEVPAAYCFVEQGTTQADTGWVCTSDQGGTLNTTAITWAQFSGGGAITAGGGLTKTGNTIDVVGTTNRISVAADSIDIDANYVGQATITTLGTIGTGTWNATIITVARGGTGVGTLTGYVKGSGTNPFTASATIPNTDITGLGTMSTQNANAVAITGGTIDGVTLDGGTF